MTTEETPQKAIPVNYGVVVRIPEVPEFPCLTPGCPYRAAYARAWSLGEAEGVEFRCPRCVPDNWPLPRVRQE